MKFVDEATMKVHAGNGGRGCVSFRREKFVPFGGPDGGDGGLGGSVWLKAVTGINTLADFRINRTFKAKNGEGGSGNDVLDGGSGTGTTLGADVLDFSGSTTATTSAAIGLLSLTVNVPGTIRGTSSFPKATCGNPYSYNASVLQLFLSANF